MTTNLRQVLGITLAANHPS